MEEGKKGKQKDKKTKRKLCIASVYELEATEQFFEEQAAKGWMIKKYNDYFLHI